MDAIRLDSTTSSNLNCPVFAITKVSPAELLVWKGLASQHARSIIEVDEINRFVIQMPYALVMVEDCMLNISTTRLM